ncbi:DrmB family protein [Nocardia sp. SC052]|uniref:DrmB family protein n=1 Tax=Nocardia sichangensis TaxID=3385975 RepID=UPI0039A28F86
MMNRSAKPTTDPSRIGSIRPSHLVTTAGIGAVVDLPSMSVVVRGADSWSAVRQEVLIEPRLLEEVRRVLGDQVSALKSAPWDPHADDDPWTRVGVPVAPFPGWVRCPACFRLGPLHGSEQFTVVHRWGRRPDLAKIVHSGCVKQGNRADAKKRACVPARFLVVCSDGHLDDFPYSEFVHASGTKGPCGVTKLRMHDSASTLQPVVTISCESCGASANIQRASGKDGSANLPDCRGRHPHLQAFEACGNPLRMIVLGASNLWFSVTASALHLPQADGIEEIIAAQWDLLAELPKKLVSQIVNGMEELRSLRDVPIDQLWEAIEKRRTLGDSPQSHDADLLDAEWKLLSRPTTEKQDEDFRAVPNSDVPQGYSRIIDQVVRVSRLREIQALVGFTRLNAPERRNLQPENLVKLRNGPAKWVPAVEKRGEGIFLEFNESRIRQWESQAEEHPRIVALRGAYHAWKSAVGEQPQPAPPIARMVLLHTLSHLLIRQVSLECGYSSASIQERLYLGRPGAPTAGLLLSTAASDSEGTLGGLVSLGETKHLKRLLDGAMHDAMRCSSDPLCSEHVPTSESPTLHLAACHACLFISETSCETNNRWLDRGVLVDISRDGLVFPL